MSEPVAIRRWLGLPVSLPEPWSVGGHAWAVHLPELAYMADRPSFPRVSFVVVYEDGSPLSSPHAPLNEIRELGGGRFAHWGEHLVFSASDGSDPRSNGRRYSLSRAWWLYRRHYRSWPVTGVARTPRSEPVNFRVRDSRDEAVARDVHYALQVAEGYLSTLPGGEAALKGSAVLEIGPGHNLGSALCLAALGAQVMVVDPFPPAWDAQYHPRLYAALRDRLARERPGWDTVPIRKVIETASHESVLRMVTAGAESMAEVPDASMDLALSNAVLEHSADLSAAAVELARVTRPGGLGIHQVDHGDHRDRDRPLEYLLIPDDRFERMFAEVHGECGNRFRRYETEHFFAEAGFEIEDVGVTDVAERRYAEKTAKRLRRAKESRYRGLDKSQIEELGCRYVVRRKGGLG
jgi:SAM-dependent methyltransferase